VIHIETYLDCGYFWWTSLTVRTGANQGGGPAHDPDSI
jgi:hypothetical protein